jgi:hypothetical protein
MAGNQEVFKQALPICKKKQYDNVAELTEEHCIQISGLNVLCTSWDSSVGTAIPGRVKIFLFST